MPKYKGKINSNRIKPGKPQSYNKSSGIYCLLFRSRTSYIQKNPIPDKCVSSTSECTTVEIPQPCPFIAVLNPAYTNHLFFFSLSTFTISFFAKIIQRSTFQQSFPRLTSHLFFSSLEYTLNSHRFSRFLIFLLTLGFGNSSTTDLP